MVAGFRVRQAREFCGLTQTDLASRVGISQGAIANIEAGRKAPSETVLEGLAFQLGFPVAFFRRGTDDHFPLGSLIFRAKAAMTAKERAQLHRYGQVIYGGIADMAAKLDTGLQRIPRLNPSQFESPAHAAVLTRAALGLSPDAPVNNLMAAVERAGVFVVGLPLQSAHADAFSVWADDRPVIVVFQHVPGDRLRFSVAHELGHLVMHQPIPGDDKQREAEAFAFAGELLMPEGAARAEMISPITLSVLAKLKPRWGMAMSALIMRAHRLELISTRQQRYLFQQMAQRGWRAKEPANLDVPVERPRAMRKMAELLYGERPDYRRMATDLALPLPLLRSVVEGSASAVEMTPVGPIPEPSEPRLAEIHDLAAHRRGKP